MTVAMELKILKLTLKIHFFLKNIRLEPVMIVFSFFQLKNLSLLFHRLPKYYSDSTTTTLISNFQEFGIIYFTAERNSCILIIIIYYMDDQ